MVVDGISNHLSSGKLEESEKERNNAGRDGGALFARPTFCGANQDRENSFLMLS